MGRRDGARKSNVLSEAVIVTIQLNNVSITCNQLFCILNQQNTGERLQASFTEDQDSHSISIFEWCYCTDNFISYPIWIKSYQIKRHLCGLFWNPYSESLKESFSHAEITFLLFYLSVLIFFSVSVSQKHLWSLWSICSFRLPKFTSEQLLSSSGFPLNSSGFQRIRKSIIHKALPACSGY